MVASRENFPLLDELIAEQQRLATPVALFSADHERGSLDVTVARHRSLIPLTAPRSGEQYAFEVDLDSCTGCKSCVAACHSLNGLDDTETWRDVGLLVSSEPRHPFAQTVTTACHHCADPACLNGCPVLAYEKDPVTGIVRHLDDQCIGCSYCILKCPYDVPKFSRRLGIVRKCDMCHDRLAHGEAPACAQACPTQAIRIVTVPTATAGQAFLPAAPDADYTRPTTRYVSRRPLPADAIAADAAALRPQPTHWPLVVMLTLMSLAIGCSCVAAFGPLFDPPSRAVEPVSPSPARLVTPHMKNPAVIPADPPKPIFTYYVKDGRDAPPSEPDRIFTYYVKIAAVSAGALGLLASVFHLGQPRRAWRVFLGWRRSWLSREAMLFGAWFGAAVVALAFPVLIAPVALLGVAALACSVMIYVDTRRYFWRQAQTGPRFFGAAAVLGIATALACGGPPALGIALVVVTVVKLAIESVALEPLHGDRDTISAPRTTALLLAGPLGGLNFIRIICGITGGMMMPVLLLTSSAAPAVAFAALLFCLAGEVAERVLFFRAVDAPKMPGMPA